MRNICLGGCLFVVLISEIVFPQWSTDPTINTPVNIEIGAQIYPFVCTDMKGGAIVTWQDKGTDIYAQRIDKYGYLKWDSAGVPICTAENTQQPIQIISDGFGGAIILWKDYRELPGLPTHISYSNTIYVQKVDSNGVVQWEADGIQISEFRHTDEYGYTFATYSEGIDVDQQGGVYIGWSLKDSLYDYNVYIQRVRNDGEKAWGEYGKHVGKIEGSVNVRTDLLGGMYLYIRGADLYRYSCNGEMLWDSVLTVRCGREPVLVNDENGGVFISGWYSQSSSVQLSHVDQSGQKLMDDLVFYCNGRPRTLISVSDQSNGVYVFWMDVITLTHVDRYLARVDYYGNILWKISGEHVAPDAIDSEGSFIDIFSHQAPGYRIYAMKYDNMGNTVWSEDSVLIYSRGSYSTGFVGYWQALGDDEGGAMLFWAEHDNLTGNYDIMAQLVNSNGGIGRPGNPIISEATNPKTFILHRNYPNPFNPITIFSYELPEESHVKISVYDISGRRLETLINQEQNAGRYDVQWNASQYPSGVYLYQIKAGNFSQVRKCMLVK